MSHFFVQSRVVDRNQICDTSLVGVDLAECPIPIWKSRDHSTSASNPLVMEYVPYEWTFPGLDPVTHEVIPDAFVTMTVKTFKVADLPLSIPAPTLVWVCCFAYLRMLCVCL